MSGVLETQQGEAAARVSAGQQLRRAREAAGLHVAALAGALKVPVHKLEALEADDYAAFPDTVFMRALASSICRSLGLDAQPVLDQLPRSAPKGFDAQRTHLNAPIKERAGKSGGGMAASNSGVSRKAIGAVVVLLIGAAAVYFLPSGFLDRDDSGESTPAMLSQPADMGATDAAAAAAAAVGMPAPDTPAAAALPAEPADMPAAAAAPAAETPAPAAEAAGTPAAVASAPSAPVASPGQAMLVFGATAPSWIQVKDTRGTVVLQKNLTAGESAQVAAALPVQVVVGRVDVTTLQVQGQAFDLAAVSRDNVARFEVKQ
ncbi:helix-turn-helix domain-containing protein [Pantoea sp. 18069]|uniref:helix-turn-helix domain-containing protein n=1 Tax=Pantoea sp. 18069 TaxID=2681415 RepID=UPI0013572EA9|nr:helix-turn-helix domain-containing protein [Pantoea sp. 18069]